MSKSTTTFRESKSTKGSAIASKSYCIGEKYTSRKTEDKTYIFASSKEYISIDVASRTSTASSRAHDKVSKLNTKLKEIAR